MDVEPVNRVCSVCGNAFTNERAAIPAGTPPGLAATLERFAAACYRVPVCPACRSRHQRAPQAGNGGHRQPAEPPRLPYSDA